MGLLDIVHRVVDRCLAFVKIVQNRKVGWLTVNRKNGQYTREQQPLFKKIKLLILFNPMIEWLDRTFIIRYWIHDQTLESRDKVVSASSRKQIKPFVEFYGINMNDFDPSDINAYPNFQEFFIRKHKAGTRPIYQEHDPTKAVIVADCRAVVYDTLAQTTSVWIKGKDFTIGNLVQDQSVGQQYADCAVASFRLSPQDYHRYHSPVQGTVKWWKQISGNYYQVDPLCLRSKIGVLTENARCVVCISTREFGDVLFVAIGATDVGTVKIHEHCRTPGSRIRKGEEIGIFEYGGSSIVVAFEKGRIRFDEDLRSVSRRAVQMDVEVGMSMGTATQPAA